jgi:hypothetical protein
VLNVVLLRHREDIDARHVCNDFDAGRMVVRNVRAVRKRACCTIAGGSHTRLHPMIWRRLRSLL